MRPNFNLDHGIFSLCNLQSPALQHQFVGNVQVKADFAVDLQPEYSPQVAASITPVIDPRLVSCCNVSSF